MIASKEFYDNHFLAGSLAIGVILMIIIYYTPALNTLFLADSEIAVPAGVTAVSANTFQYFGMWVALLYGIFIIPTIQIYKWAALKIRAKYCHEEVTTSIKVDECIA